MSTAGARSNARLRPWTSISLPKTTRAAIEIRRWFAEHPAPTPRELVDAGYVVPHWPRPYGLDADPALQLIIEGEMRRAGVSKPLNPIGIGHCGPIIVALGNDEQKQRYLLPMLAGEELWCQLFSEPGAGSDLANLATRAERDGDIYRVNGQKIWTSLADHAKFGILIARTRNDVSKHRGISYFIISMDLPGIEVRPIRNMTGESGFNEVFFTDVRVPAENLIGEENLGWGMAKSTLANERVSLSTGGGLQWGYGPSARDLVAHFRDSGGLADVVARQAGRRRVHRGRDPALPPHADDLGRGEQEARARRVAAQGARRPARQDASSRSPRTSWARAACSTDERHARRRLGPRLPLQPGADGRRRHERGAAQHHRRTAARPPPRPRRRTGQDVVGDARRHGPGLVAA